MIGRPTRLKSSKQTTKEFKQKIEATTSGKDRKISEAMLVLLSALEVGPSVDSLVGHTGYAREVVEPIVTRMREAGLWNQNYVDDREWWDERGEFIFVGLFSHALVALGQVDRRSTLTGAEYTYPDTGEVAGEWQCPYAIN